MMINVSSPIVWELVLAARSAAIRINADLFSSKQSLPPGDGKGKLQPFNRSALSQDDCTWVEQEECRFQRLNSALAASDAAISNPAGI